MSSNLYWGVFALLKLNSFYLNNEMGRRTIKHYTIAGVSTDLDSKVLHFRIYVELNGPGDDLAIDMSLLHGSREREGIIRCVSHHQC